MAEPLSHEASHGHGHNILGGVDRATYLNLLQRYADADDAIAEAVGDRKNLRAEIKGLGIPLRAWDRARRDADVSGEKRELEELAYRQLMAWQLKPSGFQASFDLGEELSEAELRWIEGQGLDAGKTGRRRDSNSYTPGTAAHVQWDNGWLDGSAASGADGGNGAAEPEPPPKRRGRPRKNPDEAAARARAHLGEGEESGAEPAEQTQAMH